MVKPMRNIVFLILGFYFLTLFESSFLPHFSFWHLLNLVLIAVVLINLFEARKGKIGLFSAFFGGFFLDIFSENFIGFWILILSGIAIFIKLVFKKNVRILSIFRI
jgi:rod shape-determining protein MreD